MRECDERQKIIDWLYKTRRGEISNIIFNLVQFEAVDYDAYSRRFEIPLEKLRTGNLRTTYFDDPKNPRGGIVENTPIWWVATNLTFSFWIEE